jgi:hypothetical protein
MRIRSIRPVLLALVVLILSSASFGQVVISVAFGPPALPVYEQPLCPGDGYIWTPGFWAWSDDDGDYYWVPGTWVMAPEASYLWTPPYWAWVDGGFAFYDGYWSPVVGFYGGINYGFGYFGEGFEGGRWDNGRFFYNRAVTNVNVTVIHNVYNTTVVNRTNVSRVSYNGGNGGVSARPTPRDEAAARQRHLPPAGVQTQHIQAARRNPELRASANHGKPPVAATARPGAFSGRDAVPAREAGAPYNPPNRGNAKPRTENGGRPAAAVHPHELPPVERPAPNSGNSKADRKYQQQQQQLQQKQDQERQKLQQRQDQEHQRLDKQNVNEARRQQTEQRHQQQTQQLQQREVQQKQRLEQRQAPSSHPESRPPQR